MNFGSEVLDVGEAQQARLGVDPEVGAQGRQRGADVGDRVLMFVLVLRGREQRGTERPVVLRRPASGHRPGQHQRVELPPGAPDI